MPGTVSSALLETTVYQQLRVSSSELSLGSIKTESAKAVCVHEVDDENVLKENW